VDKVVFTSLDLARNFGHRPGAGPLLCQQDAKAAAEGDLRRGLPVHPSCLRRSSRLLPSWACGRTFQKGTSATHRRWTDKDPSEKQAVYANRRRTKGNRGKQLSRLRSELTERSFAHVCDTGGARRTWLRGLVGVTKRHLMAVAARNLSVIMRALCGIGSPKALQGLRALAELAWSHFEQLISALESLLTALVGYGPHRSRPVGG
jgi:hypothetical protein